MRLPRSWGRRHESSPLHPGLWSAPSVFSPELISNPQVTRQLTCCPFTNSKIRATIERHRLFVNQFCMCLNLRMIYDIWCHRVSHK